MDLLSAEPQFFPEQVVRAFKVPTRIWFRLLFAHDLPPLFQLFNLVAPFQRHDLALIGRFSVGPVYRRAIMMPGGFEWGNRLILKGFIEELGCPWKFG